MEIVMKMDWTGNKLFQILKSSIRMMEKEMVWILSSLDLD